MVSLNRASKLAMAGLLLILLASPTLASPTLGSPPATAAPAPPWTHALQKGLEAAEARFPGKLGVYVHHLGRDEHLSYRAGERWYLASGIKVAVAIAVLRLVESGDMALDSAIVLSAADKVDGAGDTNRHRIGSPLCVDYLLEQMIRHSDNTATDMLIRRVGLAQINDVARELLAAQDLVITSLADVRRLAYSGFHARAAGLTSDELLVLRRAAPGPDRVKQLASLLGVSPAEFLLQDMDMAFDAYYATEVNSARLSEFGRMLAALANGLALRPEGTHYLLDLMSRVETGSRRLRARLPADVRFAHKTGTQHRRVCDLGIATANVGGREEHVVIAACARGDILARSERALRDVAASIAASGVLALPSLEPGKPHVP